MNSDYKVGDLIYDANIYDGMNTSMDDLQFYKRWLPCLLYTSYYCLKLHYAAIIPYLPSLHYSAKTPLLFN